jgi:hypothetical protein
MPVAGWRDARTVIDVANRIGHTRRPFRHKVSSSSTRPEKTAQEGVFSMCLCGSITVQSRTSAFTHPSCRLARREVPFLTGQKGDEKSRRAIRAAADGSAPRQGHESVARFATRPSAGQIRPRRRTAKGPGKESATEVEESRRYRSRSVLRRKERRSGEGLNPRLGLTQHGERSSESSSILDQPRGRTYA